MSFAIKKKKRFKWLYLLETTIESLIYGYKNGDLKAVDVIKGIYRQN